MISVELAQALRNVGLPWTPQSGDRFVVANRGMDEEIFVLSSMTIEVQDFSDGRLIKFNGTTEWALDSLDQDDALWLPNEDQLRTALGGSFQRLEWDDGEHRVEVSPQTSSDATKVFAHPDAAEAYGLALLFLMKSLV